MIKEVVMYSIVGLMVAIIDIKINNIPCNNIILQTRECVAPF